MIPLKDLLVVLFLVLHTLTPSSARTTNHLDIDSAWSGLCSNNDPSQVEALRQLVASLLPPDRAHHVSSLTCSEMQPPTQKMEEEPFEMKKQEETEPLKQVIFIQVPEEQVQLNMVVPQTTVYVLPPKRTTHRFRIMDYRVASPPVVNYLNFNDYDHVDYANTKSSRSPRRINEEVGSSSTFEIIPASYLGYRHYVE